MVPLHCIRYFSILGLWSLLLDCLVGLKVFILHDLLDCGLVLDDLLWISSVEAPLLDLLDHLGGVRGVDRNDCGLCLLAFLLTLLLQHLLLPALLLLVLPQILHEHLGSKEPNLHDVVGGGHFVELVRPDCARHIQLLEIVELLHPGQRISVQGHLVLAQDGALEGLGLH